MLPISLELRLMVTAPMDVKKKTVEKIECALDIEFFQYNVLK